MIENPEISAVVLVDNTGKAVGINGAAATLSLTRGESVLKSLPTLTTDPWEGRVKILPFENPLGSK